MQGYYKKSSVDEWQERVDTIIKNSKRFLLISSEVKNKIDELKRCFSKVVTEINTLPQLYKDYNDPKLLQKAHDTFVKEAGDLLRSYPKVAQSQDKNIKNNWIISAQLIINQAKNFIKFGNISMKNITLIDMQIREIEQKYQQLIKK